MPPTTGNTLAPGYNTVNPAEAKGVFDVNRFAEQPQPERMPETNAPWQPSAEGPTIAELHALAENNAATSFSVLNQEAAAPARPVREAAHTPEYYQETVFNSARSVVTAREGTLDLDAHNPEQRAKAHLN